MGSAINNAEVVRHDDHIVTAKEALEPLFVKVELEADARMLAAALQAGWSASEALEAICELRRDDASSPRGH